MVQSEIPAHRLLTFDLRDGWPPLCEFLEVDVPQIRIPQDEFVEGVRAGRVEAGADVNQ